MQGGLEDWAYAASWDAPVVTCTPQSALPPYPADRTGPGAYTNDQQVRVVLARSGADPKGAKGGAHGLPGVCSHYV